MLIISLALNRTQFVVIWVVAISATMAGKATGDITGWIAGETYDAINEYQSK